MARLIAKVTMISEVGIPLTRITVSWYISQPIAVTLAIDKMMQSP
jgi:hypothetical protein